MQSKNRRRVNFNFPLSSIPNRRFSWKVVVIVLICSLVTGLGVRFFENIHYSNLLLQLTGQANTSQAQLSTEQTDFKYVINHDPGQLNCYQLQSSSDRNICYAHDH